MATRGRPQIMKIVSFRGYLVLLQVIFLTLYGSLLQLSATGIPGAMNYQKLSGDNFFTSVDKGKSWSLMNSGLNHPRIRAIAINSKGIIFAGSAGGGVYKSISPVNFR